MYSGNDSTEAQNYTQWALNPSTYQNMSNDQVDWAALAQQWIIMKEAGPPVPEQIATNVPLPSVGKPKKEISHEGGEAPMEVENDSEDVQPQWNDGAGSGDSWSWNQQQPWGWNNSWPAPSGVPPPNTPKPPLLPTPAYNQYSSNDNGNDNSSYGYTTTPSADYQGGYWTAAGSSKVIKPHNKRYSKVNVPTPVATPKPVTIDAAKRKQLPAWIREGLEKMERDKLKQLDKERERQEKEEYEAKLKISEKNALEILKSTVKEQQRSKFESDQEDSDNDTDGRPLTPEEIPLSQEELMLKVRRTMTEILLKVTNREIYSICREELQRHVKKLKASDHHVSAPSGANLSAKLGLGAYGESGSSDSSDDDSCKDHHDSDTDLKDIIKRRKAEFSKTEREIEDKLAESERNDGGDSSASSPDNSVKDSQVDANIPGGRSRIGSAEHTPPIKNVHSSRTVHKLHRDASSSDDSDSDIERNGRYRDRKMLRDAQSSSSLSSVNSDTYRRSGLDRSRTPDKRSRYSYGESEYKTKYSESKSSTFRRSRSKSSSYKRRRSRSSSLRRSSRHDSTGSRSRYSTKRSHSRSRSRSSSRHRSSYDRSRSLRSSSRNRRSRSRSYSSRRRSRSRQRSRSPFSRSYRQRRSRSYSNGRGKRSHRH